MSIAIGAGRACLSCKMFLLWYYLNWLNGGEVDLWVACETTRLRIIIASYTVLNHNMEVRQFC